MTPEEHERKKIIGRRSYNKDPRKALMHHAKQRAKKTGVPFELTVDDIFIPNVCPVLGIPIGKQEGKHNSNSATLDRLLPSRGYVKGNVFVMSMRANRIKNDATIEELLKVVEFMRSNISNATHHNS